MTERKNLKIQEDVFEAHNERREELGLTWSEYLRRCSFDADHVGDGAIPTDLQEKLDRIEAAATTAEERTGSIQHTLEELGR